MIVLVYGSVCLVHSTNHCINLEYARLPYHLFNQFLLLLLLLQYFYIPPLQDCLLRIASSPASAKHNGLESREEGDGAINGYLAECNRKAIPGHRASNRKGTALPSGSPRAGNDKFRFRGGAGQPRRWTCVVEQQSSRKYGWARPSMQRLTKTETL